MSEVERSVNSEWKNQVIIGAYSNTKVCVVHDYYTTRYKIVYYATCLMCKELFYTASRP